MTSLITTSQSPGGANGAFWGRLACGLTSTGKRPEFTTVTGVSTGALTAPFAFMRPDCDDEMKEVYTSTTTKNIAKQGSLFSAAFGDSMTDTAPLKTLLAKYLVAEMMKPLPWSIKEVGA